MSDEEALLASIAADPAAALPRLVYADWLDDRGDGARAELVRLEEHLAARTDDDAALVRFRDLAAGCDPGWLARVVRPEVARCGLRFAFACPKRWADLVATADPAVRHCDGCAQPVYLSVTRAEVRRHARDGRCVAVDARLVDPAEARPDAGGVLSGEPLGDDFDLGLPRSPEPPVLPPGPPRRRGPGRHRRRR